MVLDASAIIALILKEPGYEVVAELVAQGPTRVSAVNAAEALTRLQRIGLDAKRTRAMIEGLGVEIVAFAAEDAVIAADLAMHVRTPGLSLGDRACLALGARLGAVVVTADRIWAGLDVGVEVHLIR